MCRVLHDCSAVYLGRRHIHSMLLPASTTLTIHSSYTFDWCIPTYLFCKDDCSNMSDPPMAASSKVGVVYMFGIDIDIYKK